MANADKCILTIDLGTSGPKVALVNTVGEIIGYEFEPTSLYLSPKGGAEQDPTDWWEAICKASRRLIKRDLIKNENIIAVSCTAQWSGIVAVGKDAHPLMNALIWMDTRGAPYIEKAVKGRVNFQGYGLGKILKWIKLTGGAPGLAGKDSIAHILYIKQERPEIYQETFKFLEPKDYLNLVLTGCFAAAYDSIAMHWITDNRDLSKIRYDQHLLDYFSLDVEKFPELKPTLDILGQLKSDAAMDLGIIAGIPVVMGAPDFQSAAIGSGAVNDYEGHLYIGTSSWITCHIPFLKTDTQHYLGSVPSSIPDRNIISCEQECAGVCLSYFKDNILYHADELSTDAKFDNIYEIFSQIAEKVAPGAGKIIFTPWLYGERTPVDDSTIRSGFYNLSLQSTREHIIRSIFEGVAYNSKWMLICIEKFIKRRMETINMIGGGAQSNIWCQIHADVLERTIRQLKNPIMANSRGAGILAAVALGYISFTDVPKNTQFENIYEPNPNNRAIYDELFKEFLAIYKNNHKMYARLNK